MRKPKPYSRKIENNLLKAYRHASELERAEGAVWYHKAHDCAVGLASKYDVTLSVAAGVMAGLSPGTTWELNCRQTEEFLAAFAGGARGKWLPTLGAYGRANIVKCERICLGEDPLDVLGGPKVRSFYQNILNPEIGDAVTVDRHAKCCAHGVKTPKNDVVREYEYEYLAGHFRKAASKVGLLPHQFQAVVWLVWRGLEKNLAALNR